MSNIVKAASAAAVIISAVGSFWMTDPGFAYDNGAQLQQTLPVIQTQTVQEHASQDNKDIAAGDTTRNDKIEANTPADTVIVTDETGKNAEVAAADVAAIEKKAEAIIEKMESPRPKNAGSLAALVSGMPTAAKLSAEAHCLAGAVYFESKSESLAGQLAVARVVINRAKSGRFPSSLCGVVYQPSQFSFVRGRSMPAINKAGQQWKNAVAIAQIAMDNSWKSTVEDALFFHAKYVSPGWKLRRIAQVDNHVFYR